MEQSETDASREAPRDRREADAPADTAGPSSGDNNAPERQEELSLYEIIRKHAADTPFASCFGNRHTEVRTICDHDNRQFKQWRRCHPGWVLSSLHASVASNATVLILEDIDEAWCDTLCERYPDSLCWMFLARHIVRAGDQGASSSSENNEAYTALALKVAREISARCHSTATCKHKSVKFHIDCELDIVSRRPQGTRSVWDPVPGDKFRWEVFQEPYEKLSTRISCSQLTDFLYVALVDRQTPPRSFPEEFMMATAYVWPVKRLLLPIMSFGSDDKMDGNISISTVEILLGMFVLYTVQSLFNPPAVPRLRESENRGTLRLVFRWMLAASAWQVTVDRLGDHFAGIRRGIFADNVASEQAFRMLSIFRRKVVYAHRFFVETKATIDAEMAMVPGWVKAQDSVDETSIGAENIAGPSGAALFKKRADARGIQELFEELDQTMRGVIATLTEEIQLLIGYAQVQDAKLMREQTAQTVRQTELALDLAKSTKQQAEWTTLLAVLAAFYLPLTLVTGIYGMNITEINNGVPNKNWVLGSWAVAFVLTLGGCAAGWASAKRWRGRREKGRIISE